MKQNSGVYVKVLCQRGRTKCGFGSKVVKLVYTINVTLNIHDVALLNTISSMIHAWVCMTLRWMPPSFECRCRVWILPIIWMTPSYNECPLSFEVPPPMNADPSLNATNSPQWHRLLKVPRLTNDPSSEKRALMNTPNNECPRHMNGPAIWMSPPCECPRPLNAWFMSVGE